jgi:hypothetical protein
MSCLIKARIMPTMTWLGAIHFRARSLKSGFRTACRKLGVSISHGMATQRVGATQWRVTGNEMTIMVVVEKT